MRFLQLTKVAEGPCYLVSIALHISVVRGIGPQDVSYIAGYRWFLSYTNNHLYIYFLKLVVQPFGGRHLLLSL